MTVADPKPTDRRPRGKVSLASLLLATALVAVLTAAVRMSIDNVERDRAIAASVGGLLIGTLSALAVLSMERRSIGQSLAGVVAGGIFGALAGLFIVSPRSFPALAIGGIVLVLFAAAVRRLSARAARIAEAGQGSGGAETGSPFAPPADAPGDRK